MIKSKFESGYQGEFNPEQHTTILQGDQDSAPINCAGFVLSGIMLPPVFTGTALTFKTGPYPDGFKAQGQAAFSGNLSNNDVLSINGSDITFVTGTPTDGQVKIGTDLDGTLANLQAFLAATQDGSLLLCDYLIQGHVLLASSGLAGTDGNNITFTKSAANITLTPSGGTLLGGGFAPIYDSSNALVTLTVAANRFYAVDPKYFEGVAYLVISSGSTELALRDIICTLKGM